MGVIAYLPLSGSSPLTDFSGNGFNLTGNINIEVQNHSGIRKGCLANKGVTTSDRIYTDLKPTINNKTISFWLQFNSVLGSINPYIIFWHDCQIRFISGGIFRLYYFDGTTLTYTSIPSSIITAILNNNLNKWYHFVIVYNFNENSISLYLNSKLVYTFIQINMSHRISATQRIFLLGYSSVNTSLVNSKLCELVIDTETWSPAQVKNEYLKQKGLLIA